MEPPLRRRAHVPGSTAKAVALVVSHLVVEGRAGKLWPGTLALDLNGIAAQHDRVCSRVAKRAAEAFSANVPFVAQSLAPVPSIGVLGLLLSSRGESGSTRLADVAGSCNTTIIGGGLWVPCRQWQPYFLGLAWPYAVPLAVGCLSVLLHWTCCFVACCRCCRRMVCCSERQEAYKAGRVKVVLAVAAWTLATVGLLGFGVEAATVGTTLNDSMNWQMCTVLQLAQDTLAGATELRFLGIDTGKSNLQDLVAALDYDGVVMSAIRSAFQRTTAFGAQQAQLRLRLAHLLSVLNMSGPAVRAFDHRCVFCGLAVGDPRRPVTGFPAGGLLPAFAAELNASSAQAMDRIRNDTSTVFMGAGLSALAVKVKLAADGFEIFNFALHSTLVGAWLNHLPSVDAAEQVRRAVFLVLPIVGGLCAGAGTAAFAFTQFRMRTRRPEEEMPSVKPHCGAWCCAFCVAAAAFLLGGALVILVVFAGDGCNFLQLQLLTDAGVARYAPALGLLPEAVSDPSTGPAARRSATALSVDLARSCFTLNGTGDLMRIAGLEAALAFEAGLSNAFYRLDELISAPPVGKQSASILDSLRDAAELFGDMFVLDPLPAASGAGAGVPSFNQSGSLGVLPLNPTVQGLLIGSAISTEDTKGPDGVTALAGLNTYAGLIAGPGKYTFLHGTAGGGSVITPDLPSDQDLAGLPVAVRNALLYGRAKEHLLASNSSLPCDTLDNSTGVRKPRRCGVRAFHEYVVAEVALLRQQADAVAAEAQNVQSIFTGELRVKLMPILRKIQELRLASQCRFLWGRLQTMNDALCGELAPGLATSAAALLLLGASAGLGIVVHYKVWRHMKDNKTVGQEMERFERTYAEFREKIRVVEERTRAKAAAGVHLTYLDDLEDAAKTTKLGPAEEEE